MSPWRGSTDEPDGDRVLSVGVSRATECALGRRSPLTGCSAVVAWGTHAVSAWESAGDPTAAAATNRSRNPRCDSPEAHRCSRPPGHPRRSAPSPLQPPSPLTLTGCGPEADSVPDADLEDLGVVCSEGLGPSDELSDGATRPRSRFSR